MYIDMQPFWSTPSPIVWSPPNHVVRSRCGRLCHPRGLQHSRLVAVAVVAAGGGGGGGGFCGVVID